MNRVETPRNSHFHQTPEGIDAWSHANRGVLLEDARQLTTPPRPWEACW